MKQTLQKKTRKPSHKDIERVQLGCAMMQETFSFDGILRKEILMTLLDVKHVQKIYKNSLSGQPSRSPQGYSLYRRKG